MIPALALLLTAKADALTTIQASESVWVYSHASDPSGDQLLRIWGAGGLATPEGKGEGEDWSYGYLKWDVSTLPTKPPKSAILVLYNVNPAGFGDAESAKGTPLQARGLIGAFSGKTWDYSLAVQVRPDLEKSVFGSAAPASWGTSKDPIKIEIDLMKGPGDFKAYLAAAESGKDHALQLALTSAIDPNTADGGGGKGGVYKVYSATADVKWRPTLVLGY